MRPHHPEREERFRALYAAHHLDVLRFVARRAHSDAAEDVVAEAFLVAWRRLDDALPWPSPRPSSSCPAAPTR